MYKKVLAFLLSIISLLCFAEISVESRLFFDFTDSSPSLSVYLKNIGDELADAVELHPMKKTGEGLDVLSIGSIRPGEKVEKIVPLTKEQSDALLTSSSCCAFPFLFLYQDRYGNEFSSCLLSTCVNEHSTVNPKEAFGVLASSACLEVDSATQSLTITVIYNYDRVVAAGVNKISVSYYLPKGIAPLEETTEQKLVFDIKKNGLVEKSIILKSDIENISGDIPYIVIYEFLDANDNPVSYPIARSDVMHIEAPLNLNAFPQLLDSRIALAIGIIVFVIFVIKQFKSNTIPQVSERILSWIEWLIVVGITLYFAYMLQLPLALKGYTCMGGDLPAHHYLISHIAETGRPVSWADGWWCGFPMFHYYFPLPYTILAFFSTIFPHNIVFNLGVCLGILLLPLSVYLSCRIVRLPRPLPAIAVCFIVPLIFDNTHNMWGVNAYSTLAGMVANSWSFCLFCPALANICRDIYDNKFRLRTSLLIAAVALSHFFTSIVLALLVGIIWLCVIGYSIRNKTTHYRIPVYEGVLAILLVAWWLIPLATTGEWAVAFGSQWEISFFKQLPNIVTYFFLPSLVLATICGICFKKQENKPFYPWFFVFIVLFLISLVLFYFGRSIGEVFVNCRLWPFITFSLLFIMAGLFARIFKELPISGMLFALVLCFSFAWNDKEDDKNEIWSYLNLVSTWAKYNFSGYENSPNGDVGQELVDYLRGVEPNGRIAYDLHPFNESLGSTRFFEALPALTGHPIIEGGIVNSAIGSLTAYTVQGEMSEHTAGAPLLVEPQSFNPERGFAHLELLGVRRFIAHSNSTITALRNNPLWEEERSFGGGKWIIFKHKKEYNGLVRKWNYPIKFYISDNFQKDSLDWMYVGAAVREPFGFVQPNIITSTLTYPYSRLNELKSDTTPVGDWISDLSDDIPSNTVKNGSRYEIHFKAKELNSPYIVAMSYFPNWKVKGADGPYFVTPGFMVVYPTQEDVCVYYGYRFADIAGYVITILGIIIIVGVIAFRTLKKRSRKIA